MIYDSESWHLDSWYFLMTNNNKLSNIWDENSLHPQSEHKWRLSTTLTSLSPYCTAVKIKKPIQTKFRMPVLNWVALKPSQINGTVFNDIDDESILQVKTDMFENIQIFKEDKTTQQKVNWAEKNSDEGRELKSQNMNISSLVAIQSWR